jgi:hypothetical protein
MFVMATIYAESGSAPVKIRDLSTSGALIEGGVLPHPGSKIKLVRGSLTIGGEVAWRKGSKAGLRFDASASVAEWLPNRRTVAPQEMVDAMVQEVKTGPVTALTAAEPLPSPVSALELMRVKALIEALAEDLADDMGVVVRHGPKLQSLDLAAQLLGKLAAR